MRIIDFNSTKCRHCYKCVRNCAIKAISVLGGRAEIMEQDAGLHFLMQLDTPMSDAELRRRAAEKGVRLALLSDYYADPARAPQHVVVVNYSGIEPETLRQGMERLAELWEE